WLTSSPVPCIAQSGHRQLACRVRAMNGLCVGSGGERPRESLGMGIGRGLQVPRRVEVRRLYAPPPGVSRSRSACCCCYMKMSWGNCSVKVSCPHGDFHDEQEGTAPG